MGGPRLAIAARRGHGNGTPRAQWALGDATNLDIAQPFYTSLGRGQEGCGEQPTSLAATESSPVPYNNNLDGSIVPRGALATRTAHWRGGSDALASLYRPSAMWCALGTAWRRKEQWA